MKFKVVMTRVETYTYGRIVEAVDEDAALAMVRMDESWYYPEEPDDCEEHIEVTKWNV